MGTYAKHIKLVPCSTHFVDIQTCGNSKCVGTYTENCGCSECVVFKTPGLSKFVGTQKFHYGLRLLFFALFVL